MVLHGSTQGFSYGSDKKHHWSHLVKLPSLLNLIIGHLRDLPGLRLDKEK